jgi:hypothetical protein
MNDKAAPPPNPKGETTPGRVAYCPPVLRILGTVAQLTRGGSGSKQDGRNTTKKR